jgi:probable F420-dependent oxidoreductase
LFGGRFTLGLGSQVNAHIERRFSMPWGKPAARMREMVLAIKRIWDCWQTGEKLKFEGEFYNHTLMSPIFSPGPNEYGVPKIFLAGVGPLMTEVAAEVGDGYSMYRDLHICLFCNVMVWKGCRWKRTNCRARETGWNSPILSTATW